MSTQTAVSYLEFLSLCGEACVDAGLVEEDLREAGKNPRTMTPEELKEYLANNY